VVSSRVHNIDQSQAINVWPQSDLGNNLSSTWGKDLFVCDFNFLLRVAPYNMIENADNSISKTLMIQNLSGSKSWNKIILDPDLLDLRTYVNLRLVWSGVTGMNFKNSRNRLCINVNEQSISGPSKIWNVDYKSTPDWYEKLVENWNRVNHQSL